MSLDYRLKFEKLMHYLFDDESGSPFIFLNTFKSAERARFDCAHELVISLCIRITKIRVEKDNRVLETEADQFSSEF